MGLAKATIVNTETNESIPVMFNPEEYSLEKGNLFSEIGIPGRRTPPLQFVRGNAENLSMNLFFDTYELKRDVRDFTGPITRLLEKESVTKAPPVLLFTWGSFSFTCVLESIKRRFTMFLSDGTPVRATLAVTFKSFEPVEIEIQKGLIVGPPVVHNVIEGQTLSDIAGSVLGDPGKWRDIAVLNDIDNPRSLPTGKPLMVPQDSPDN